jgi:prepilin-type processing-associated H-X9-DG protein
MDGGHDSATEAAPLTYHTPPVVTSNPLAVCAGVGAAVLVAWRLAEAFGPRDANVLRFVHPAVACVALGVITAALALAGLALARRRRCGGGLALLSLLVGVAGTAHGASWLARSLNRQRDYAGPAACAGNLRRVGQAISLYANAHRGRFPDSLATLLLTEDLDAADLVCPCSAHTPATGPTTQAVVANLSAGGHASYTYVGNGMTYRTTSDYVVAYEAPVDHGGGKGMSVLFADGHVEIFGGDRAERLYAKLQAGHNPLTAEDWK